MLTCCSSGESAAATDSASPAAMTPPPSTQAGSSTIPQGPAPAQLLLSPTFTPVTARTVLDMTNGRIAVTVNKLDGEFIVTMAKAGVQNQVQASPGSLSSAGQTSQNSALGAEGLLPAKRQIQPSQSGLVVSMAQLRSLAEQQKNGGTLPIFSSKHSLSSFCFP